MDTSKRLNQIEAGRVKTELETKFNIRVLYRRLLSYSPLEISKNLRVKDVTPLVIAEMAGREKEKTNG